MALEKIANYLLTSPSVRKENQERQRVVQDVCAIVGTAWERIDDVLAAPVWQGGETQEYQEVRARWLLHGLDEALLATLYVSLYGLPPGVAPQDPVDVAFGFIIHDIGKVDAVDPMTWSKLHDELTPKEIDAMRAHVYPFGVEKVHALRSYGITIPGISEEILMFHHERIDGSGKPYELEGHDISFWARLAGCVDSVKSRAENHSYQRPNQRYGNFSLSTASESIYHERGQRLDGDIVEKFHDLIDNNLIYFIDIMRATDGWYKRATPPNNLSY
jgi:response regulator RpfG family c-di-GMP phosphodiesterase